MTQYTENITNIHEFAEKIRSDITRFEASQIRRNKEDHETFPLERNEDDWYGEFNFWSTLED